ncbi:MAG: ABC transporter permease [Desulfarculaceae bacterium]|nr:ABC transporter permease [Desulfarculaceae bacterium]
MLKLIARRLVWLVFTLLGVSFLCFCLSHLSPGETGDMLLRQSGGVTSSESAQRFRQSLGLDDPLLVRYARWLSHAARLDFGESFATGEPVGREMLRRLPATLKLTLAAFGLMLVLSLAVGVASGLRPGGLFDHIARVLSTILVALPNYWLGMLLLFLFAVHWKVFSVVGGTGLKGLVLPAFTLALGMSAFYGRMVRERLLEVMSQDYIRTAQAKGLPLGVVLYRHALLNAIIPLLNLWGMSFGFLLGGSLLVETIFSWPGVASFAVQAVLSRDYPVTQCYVVFMAVIFTGSNLVVDLLQTLADPKLRRKAAQEGGA